MSGGHSKSRVQSSNTWRSLIALGIVAQRIVALGVVALRIVALGVVALGIVALGIIALGIVALGIRTRIVALGCHKS